MNQLTTTRQGTLNREFQPTPAQKALKTAMYMLCDAKNVTEFTPRQLNLWTLSLATYPLEIANRALTEFTFSTDPFPNLGKVMLRAQALDHDRKGHACAPPKKVGTRAIESIAEKLGVKL